MNVQIEHLENHTARLTVSVPAERFEAAKKKAAKSVAGKISIPGFRKGKAPYNMVVRYVGEAAIVEEAVELLGQDLYREALEESQIEPYGPGSLDDIKFEETPVFVYSVPKEPTTELGDYRAVRLEYVEPEVTDEDVERDLEQILLQEAEYTETEEAIQLGDAAVLDVHAYIEEDDDEDIDDEDDEHEPHSDSPIDDPAHARGKTLVHEHAANVILREGDKEPFGPGFSASLVGVKTGETVEFDILFPNDDEISEEIRGKTAHFVVNVQSVQKVSLPELNDELATRMGEKFGFITPPPPTFEDEAAEGDEADTGEVAEGEASDEPVEAAPAVTMTVDELRAKLKEEVIKEKQTQAKESYSQKLLDMMLESATIAYPPQAVEDEIDQLVEMFKERLKEQKVSLEMYSAVTGKSIDDLRADYQETATVRIKQRLLMGEFLLQEQLSVTQADFEAHVDKMLADFGTAPEMVGMMREMFMSDNFRGNVLNRMLQERMNDRLIAIGTGNAPELSNPEESAEATAPEGKEDASETVTDTVDDAGTDENPQA